MSRDSMTTVNNVTEFLKSVEDNGSKEESFNDEDIREFAIAAGICDTEEELKIFDAFISFRKTFHDAADASEAEIPGTTPEKCMDKDLAIGQSPDLEHSLGNVGQSSDLESWKWLLTTAQVEQRTQEWYAEARNILTASEVSKIFRKNRTRDLVVAAKSQPADSPVPIFTPRLAVERTVTSPMDWGVRYEPVVKMYLEKSLKCKIHELGRIRHRTQKNIAASPDGLFTECEVFPELTGRLIEIKCPSTRIIKENSISLEYMCQMQLQMEVCDRPSCEFVEAKFRELREDSQKSETALDRGWITLQSNIETDVNRYVYHNTPSGSMDEDTAWASVETYEWELIILQRVTVLRDKKWFEESQSQFTEFWKDVQTARDGAWQITPAREKKPKSKNNEIVEKCGIVEDD